MTSTDDRRTSPAPAVAGAASKVPVVTAGFWILKVLTTGMGEAVSDSLAHAAGTVAVLATAAVTAAALVFQVRARAYDPMLYWFTVSMIAVFGTMAADVPHHLGIPLEVTTTGYLAAVLAVFAVWHRLERTLSFDAISTRRRELLYWAAVLATFALGTAVGDLTAFGWHLGALASGLIFAVLIALPGMARRWLGLGAVPAFWTAYVLTRPLGASFADWMGGSRRHGGLGWGMPATAVLWITAMAVFVGVAVLVRRRRSAPGLDG
jgi:uncharacterized membrane-anchored protein